MLRLLHTADAHLGARHEDLGEAAAALRERQHVAFLAAVDLAVAERVDGVLIAGDLFDANTASRPTVDRVVAGLARLAAARIRVVLLPGGHDAYTRSSVYRAYDIAGLVGDGMVTILTPDQPWVHLETLDAVIVGPADTSRVGTGEAAGTASPFASLPGGVPVTTWRIGLLHAGIGSRAAGDRTPGAGAEGHAAERAVGDSPREASLGAATAARPPVADAAVIDEAAIAASGLDFVALGHDHIAATGKAGTTVWAVAGAPEQVAADRREPGTVNVVTLDERAGSKAVQVETRVVGSSWHRDLEVDAAQLASQDALIERLRAAADPELVLDVRIVGERPDDLVLEPAAIEEALRGAYLCARVDDRSQPPLTTGALPPPETIAGAFIRNVEARIAELEAMRADAATGNAADADTPEAADDTGTGTGADADAVSAETEAAELREVLRLGRRLLAGSEVTP